MRFLYYPFTQEFVHPHLVIYNISGHNLLFALSDVEQSTPYIELNNKTIFFINIDIFPYEKTASKRGKMKPYEITEEYLIDAVSDGLE